MTDPIEAQIIADVLTLWHNSSITVDAISSRYNISTQLCWDYILQNTEFIQPSETTTVYVYQSRINDAVNQLELNEH